MPNLQLNYNNFISEIDKLYHLQRNIVSLAPAHQKLVAEIVLLRLFDNLQYIFKIICQKLLCGATYLDNSNAHIFVRSRSLDNAVSLLKNYGRTRPHNILKWSKVSEINNNLKFTFNSSDHFIREINFHGTFIDELRRIRNRIAHNNPNSRNKYQIIVRRYYGARLNSITPGILLMTDRNTPILILDYLLKSKVLVKNLLKA